MIKFTIYAKTRICKTSSIKIYYYIIFHGEANQISAQNKESEYTKSYVGWYLSIKKEGISAYVSF